MTNSAFGIKEPAAQKDSALNSEIIELVYGNPSAIKSFVFESEVARQRLAGNDVVILDPKTGESTRLPGRKNG